MPPPPATCTHTPSAVLQPTRSHPAAHPVTIDAARTTIGRGHDCDLTIDEPTISCRHAELICDSTGHYTLIDVGSLNGIYVNRTRASHATLADGDEIWIGKYRCILQLLEPPDTV